MEKAKITARQFAMENAGKYFLFRNEKVRVVGYCANNGSTILISIPAKVRDFGWEAHVLDDDDRFVIRSRASRYWYVDEWQLKEWKRK